MSRRPERAVLAAMLLAAVMPTAGARTDPYEPNDSWNQATPLDNGVSLEAWISPSGDHDWFTFTATTTGQLAIQLTSLPADYDLYIAHLNPETQQLDGIPYANDSGSMPEYYSGHLQATGAYYLRVYAEDGVFDAEDPYTLLVRWPSPAPIDENLLEVGTAQGAPGTAATVALMLANDDAVKALQADLTFDPAVLSFQAAQAVGRASEMTCGAALQTGGRVRVLLYDDADEHLPPGTGAVVDLTFALVGAAGSQSALTPTGVLLSDLDASALPVTTDPGALAVIDASVAPALRLYALRNPARPRTLQIFAAGDQVLSGPPVVMAGGQAVTMHLVDGAENLYEGAFHAPVDGDSLEVSASGTNGATAGTTATTVVF